MGSGFLPYYHIDDRGNRAGQDVSWSGCEQMSYQEDTIDLQIIDRVDSWLDGAVASEYQLQPLAQDWARISKVAEELGEVIQAFIGYTGQNPRKGKINEKADVVNELADVAMTAILAIQHMTKNTSETRDILMAKQRAVYERVPAEYR
jgi:hypothetical protein